MLAEVQLAKVKQNLQMEHHAMVKLKIVVVVVVAAAAAAAAAAVVIAAATEVVVIAATASYETSKSW